MDITQHELKTMKAKQLRRLIRESIVEILSETTMPTTVNYKDKNIPDKILDIDPSDVDTINSLKKDPKVGSVTIGTKKIKEGEIDEMARLAKGFKVADPNVNTAQYANKRISGVSLADIIEYIKANPGVEKAQLQSQFNFARPQIANAVVNALLDSGVVVKLSASGEEEAPVAPGEEAPTQATEPEDMFMGSGENPLSMYFDDEPNASGEEDFNASEEPTIDDTSIEKVDAKSMSDEDYEAFMKYDELNNRLAATKSNITKLKRKGSSPSDLTDKPSTELTRLRDLKTSLEDRIGALVAGSSYLKKRIEKQTGKAYVEPVVEPEETEEEPLDEWTIRKLQHYAGIIK